MFEFIQDRNMAQSVELAKLVQKRTCATAGRQNKGVKQAGFLVLRETSMPSCLIELGFISTPDEERFLNSQDGVEKLGKGIYQAFVDYYKKSGTGGSVSEVREVKEIKEVREVKEDVKQEEPKSRPKGKMARELADVREGRVPDTDIEPAKVEKKDNMEEPELAEELVKEDSVAVAKSESMPEPIPKPATETKPAPAQKLEPAAAGTTGAPIFKVQILASLTKLKPNDPQLKGQRQADFYQEGGLYKYTLGSSENYNEIYQLRKAQLTNFPQAFIIAFKNGKKMNVQEAIQEYKKSKKSK
jgi:N-acetylmuramoyl-L-alanine amidase